MIGASRSQGKSSDQNKTEKNARGKLAKGGGQLTRKVAGSCTVPERGAGAGSRQPNAVTVRELEESNVIDTKGMADAIVNASYRAGAQATVKLDVGSWSPDEVKALVDGLLGQLDDYKLRIKGIRTDSAGLSKLGVEYDYPNSGVYKGVRVVVTADVLFDAFEIVMEPTK